MYVTKIQYKCMCSFQTFQPKCHVKNFLILATFTTQWGTCVWRSAYFGIVTTARRGFFYILLNLFNLYPIVFIEISGFIQRSSPAGYLGSSRDLPHPGLKIGSPLLNYTFLYTIKVDEKVLHFPLKKILKDKRD